MRKILVCFLLAQPLLVSSTLAEWGDYQRFTAVEGIVMYVRYHNHQHCTDVAWKAENTSEITVLPSIAERQYTCRSGHVQSSDRTATVPLGPGDHSLPQRDHCVCEGEGGVMQTHATLSVRAP